MYLYGFGNCDDGTFERAIEIEIGCRRHTPKIRDNRCGTSNYETHHQINELAFDWIYDVDMHVSSMFGVNFHFDLIVVTAKRPLYFSLTRITVISWECLTRNDSKKRKLAETCNAASNVIIHEVPERRTHSISCDTNYCDYDYETSNVFQLDYTTLPLMTVLFSTWHLILCSI